MDIKAIVAQCLAPVVARRKARPTEVSPIRGRSRGWQTALFPIVGRELRAAARRHGTYGMRLLVALGAVAVGLYFYVANLRASAQSLAHAIFQGLSGLALVYCLLAGRNATADCISQEKREGTLGFLFLTNLKGHDVILGKLAATSIHIFYGLVGMLPVMALPLLLGGVSNGEFWRMALVLLNTCWFSLTVGVFASVLSREARRAMGANFLWLLLLTISLPALALGLAEVASVPGTIHWWFFPCPVYAFYMSSDITYKWQSGYFWSSMAVIHAMSWVLVGLASWIVPRSWQDRPKGSSKKSWGERWRGWSLGEGINRANFRARLLRINPFYWLAARSRLKPLGVWLFFVFMLCWWLFVHLYLKIGAFEDSFAFATALMLNWVLKLWIAIETGHRLAEDKRMGALELILSTPMGVREIWRGQLLALRRQFLAPLLVAIGVELILIELVSIHPFQDRFRSIAFGLTGIAMLLADVAAVFWVGLASALTARTHNFATINTILRVPSPSLCKFFP